MLLRCQNDSTDTQALMHSIGTNVKTYITSLVSIEHISSLLAKQTILYQKEKEMLEEKQRELQEMLDLR